MGNKEMKKKKLDLEELDKLSGGGAPWSEEKRVFLQEWIRERKGWGRSIEYCRDMLIGRYGPDADPKINEMIDAIYGGTD